MKIIFLLFLSNAVWALSPFESDGCTYFPEGTHTQPQLWAHCCLEHDIRYWIGGTRVRMKYADSELKKCVTEAAGKPLALLMFTGVRLGHLSPVKSRYRWGWGWGASHDSKSGFSAEQLAYVRMTLENSDFSEELVEKLLPEYSSMPGD